MRTSKIFRNFKHVIQWLYIYIQHLPFGVPSLNPKKKGELTPVKRNHLAPKLEGPGRYGGFLKWWYPKMDGEHNHQKGEGSQRQRQQGWLLERHAPLQDGELLCHHYDGHWPEPRWHSWDWSHGRSSPTTSWQQHTSSERQVCSDLLLEWVSKNAKILPSLHSVKQSRPTLIRFLLRRCSWGYVLPFNIRKTTI